MATRLFSVVVDSIDHIAMTRWWSQALDVPVVGERDDEAWVQIPDGPELLFVPVREPKTTKSRIHLDLASESASHHAATVERLLALGATHADIGQGETRWVVLADPEGNEFCVLPAGYYDEDTGPVGAICIAAVDRSALVAFWAAATGWPVVRRGLHRGQGPFVVFGGGKPAPKQTKNRIHLDVAPFAGDDHAAEVSRLEALGARRIDIGQGDVSWVVMADPEDNEFCVLTPR